MAFINPGVVAGLGADAVGIEVSIAVGAPCCCETRIEAVAIDRRARTRSRGYVVPRLDTELLSGIEKIVTYRLKLFPPGHHWPSASAYQAPLTRDG